jgi:hypothetical protein
MPRVRRWACEEICYAHALADQGSYVEAYQLAASAEHYILTDSTLRSHDPSRGFSVETTLDGDAK